MSDNLAFKYDLFISYYNATGSQFASYLRTKLLDFGYTSFLDVEDIPKKIESDTDEWRKIVDRAISNSKGLILIMTLGFNLRPEVRRELEVATEHGIKRMYFKHANLKHSDLIFKIEDGLDLSKFEYTTFHNEPELLTELISALRSSISYGADFEIRNLESVEPKSNLGSKIGALKTPLNSTQSANQSTITTVVLDTFQWQTAPRAGVDRIFAIFVKYMVHDEIQSVDNEKYRFKYGHMEFHEEKLDLIFTYRFWRISFDYRLNSSVIDEIINQLTNALRGFRRMTFRFSKKVPYDDLLKVCSDKKLTTGYTPERKIATLSPKSPFDAASEIQLRILGNGAEIEFSKGSSDSQLYEKINPERILKFFKLNRMI